MKIIELTNEFSMGNGISEVIRTLSDGLVDNFQVEIWYKYFLRNLPSTKANLIKKSYYQMLKDLLYIKEKTILHTHFGRTFFIGSLVKIINPNIIHIHTEYINTPVSASGGKPSSYLFIEFLHKISYLFGKGIDLAVGISKYACNEISRYGVSDRKIKLIYLGIDSSNKNNVKQKIPISFGSLARFSKSKNLKFLLENYKGFPPNSKLYVAGAIDVMNRKYFDDCEQLAKTRAIKLTPNLPREDWANFYSNFDVFLYPSNWEGFGLPILEAMSYGKPVICFNKYAMPEIVKNGHNGFVVNNEEEFVDKINFLYSHPKIVKKMSKNAILTSKKFTKRSMIEKYISLIKELKMKK
jgi:glycosyltransferase involved in cell wall biosynthesis